MQVGPKCGRLDTRRRQPREDRAESRTKAPAVKTTAIQSQPRKRQGRTLAPPCQQGGHLLGHVLEQPQDAHRASFHPSSSWGVVPTWGSTDGAGEVGIHVVWVSRGELMMRVVTSTHGQAVAGRR